MGDEMKIYAGYGGLTRSGLLFLSESPAVLCQEINK